MSNYVEYNGKIAFHPGYYIEELLEDSRMSKKEFAERLHLSDESLNSLLVGENRLSADTANELSKMLGTSITYWLNLQDAYDHMLSAFQQQRLSV